MESRYSALYCTKKDYLWTSHLISITSLELGVSSKIIHYLLLVIILSRSEELPVVCDIVEITITRLGLDIRCSKSLNSFSWEALTRDLKG